MLQTLGVIERPLPEDIPALQLLPNNMGCCDPSCQMMALPYRAMDMAASPAASAPAVAPAEEPHHVAAPPAAPVTGPQALPSPPPGDAAAYTNGAAAAPAATRDPVLALGPAVVTEPGLSHSHAMPIGGRGGGRHDLAGPRAIAIYVVTAALMLSVVALLGFLLHLLRRRRMEAAERLKSVSVAEALMVRLRPAAVALAPEFVQDACV